MRFLECWLYNVRYKLFRSYCTGMYGCELWYLDDSKIGDSFVVRIWNLPCNTPHTHGCTWLSCIWWNVQTMFDVYWCLHHNNDTVRFFFAWHVIKCTPGIYRILIEIWNCAPIDRDLKSVRRWWVMFNMMLWLWDTVAKQWMRIVLDLCSLCKKSLINGTEADCRLTREEIMWCNRSAGD